MSRRLLSEIIDNIELVARNRMLPREDIIALCAEAKKTTHVKYDMSNPIRVKVQEAVQCLSGDDNGIALLPSGEFMSVSDVCAMCGMQPTMSNLNFVSRALSDLGFVRLGKTGAHPRLRWFMPRTLG